MHNLKWKDNDYRNGLIKKVLGNESGVELIEMLKWWYEHSLNSPDMQNPNQVYFDLGKRKVLDDLQHELLKESKEKV